MPSLSPGPEFTRVLIIVVLVALAVALVFAIPASRRALKNGWEQASGCLDGLLTSSRPIKAARAAVERKAKKFALSLEARLNDRMMKYHDESTRQFELFQIAERTHKDAVDALARAQQEAEDDAKAGSMEKITASRSPFSLRTYYTIQGVLGIGDVIFTYFAFELWSLPTILLAPLVVLLGLLGVALGHLCGQAIAKNNQAFAIATGIGAGVQCIVLGATRFAYLLSQNVTNGVDTISAIAAFGIPFLLVFTSIIMGAQVRYPTELEKARARETAAKQLADTTYLEGEREQKRLASWIESQVNRTLEIVQTYYRGFGFGWRNEPLEFALPEVDPPEPEWPPTTSRPPLAA